MKLKQLLESFDQIRINNGDELPDTSEHTDDVKGSGAFAKVKGDKDPHMINKIATKWDTGYNAYIDFLIDNKLAQSNPHFPRVYVAQNGTKWQMEKLPHTLFSYLGGDGDRDLAKERLDTLISIYIEDEIELTSEHGFSAFMNYISSPENIKLGSYRKALTIVHDLYEKLKVEHPQSLMVLDLHSKNIMVRITPVGPQLVITDPFADMNEA